MNDLEKDNLESKLAEKNEQLMESLDALERLLTKVSHLLARIHRDGGHYEDRHGTDEAIARAEEIVTEWLSRLGQFE